MGDPQYYLNVSLPDGRTVEEVVDRVIEDGRAHPTYVETERALMSEFELSHDEVALVYDRVYGGIVRASTRNPRNRPDNVFLGSRCSCEL